MKWSFIIQNYPKAHKLFMDTESNSMFDFFDGQGIYCTVTLWRTNMKSPYKVTWRADVTRYDGEHYFFEDSIESRPKAEVIVFTEAFKELESKLQSAATKEEVKG